MASPDVHMEGQTPAPGKKYVTKRDGSKQEIVPDKVKERVAALAEGLETDHIDLDVIVGKVMAGVYDGKFLTIRRHNHCS